MKLRLNVSQDGGFRPERWTGDACAVSPLFDIFNTFSLGYEIYFQECNIVFVKMSHSINYNLFDYEIAGIV